MSGIVLHQLTATHLDRFIAQPTHALLLTGTEGVGKQHTANYAALRLIAAQGDIRDYPYLRMIEPEKDKASIGIEAVRGLQQFVKLKLPADQPWRIILIPEAGGLTIEAQNALLKLLEEPPERTIFLLCATSEQALLPTIRSRSQHMTVHPPTQTDLIPFFEAQGHSAQEVQQAYMMSGGLPGLMHALLNEVEHPLKAAVLTARQLLQSSQFERLCFVDSLSKDKPAALQVIFVLQHMARAAIVQGSKAADGSASKRIKQWHKVQQAAYDAERAYAVSAQAKLTLTNLMLSL